ncbi:MAG: hypothetical protein K8S24_07230, partial [Candidatus Aegiribacteria sp.]|nr:hypothetical protein [Candidatus Aegiribacteria sp.]
YFFIDDHQIIKERSFHELNNQKKIFNAKYISSLIKSKKDLLTNQTEEEREILYSFYPELR